MRRIVPLAALVVAALACNGPLNEGVMPGESVAPTSEDDPLGTQPPNADEASVLAGVALDGTPVRSPLVRLTHAQWEHAVRDVLRLDQHPGLASTFTGDPPEGSFSNNERALTVTPNLRLDYQRAAEELSQRVARDPAALARIFPGADGSDLIESFGRRAYRRELTADERARYRTLFDSGPSAFGSDDARADGIAGSGGGFLRTGQYVDAGGVGNQRLLNTLITANGARRGGGPVLDFGAPDLQGGLIDALVA